MNLSSLPPSPPRNGYFLPEHARYQLVGVIEHLELLSQVVASRTAHDERDAWLQCRPDQLAWFAQLAQQLAPVLADLEGPAPITLGARPPSLH